MLEKVRSIRLQQLNVFITTAREGSFSKAAEALFLSEPAVSRQIKMLEQAVGARLFDRAPRKPIRMTEAGRHLLGVSQDVFDRLEHGVQELDALKRAEQGLVSFGARRHFCSYLLPSLYASFQALGTGIELRMNMGSREYLLDQLLRKGLDLIVVDNQVDDGRLESVALTAVDLVLVALPDHPLVRTGPAPFSVLASEPLVLTARKSSSVRRALEQRAAESGISLQVAWVADNAEAEIHAVKSGLGIALVPFYTVAAHVATGAFSVLAIEGFPMQLDWFVAWRSGELSGHACEFKEHLLRHRDQLAAVSRCPDYVLS